MMQKKKFSDVNVDNIPVSKISLKKSNSKHLIWYLDKVIGLIVLTMAKMSGYVKTFKIKDGGNDKDNKLISFCIENENL